jgi:hypothetical protein
MVNESHIRVAGRIARRLAQASLALAALSVAAVAAAIVWPIAPAEHLASVAKGEGFAPIADSKQNLQGVLDRLSSRQTPLISPPQVQAAVKDSGSAAKLVKRLKLQGIVQIGGGYVAYVQVEEQGLKTVKKGESLLDFVVQEVAPGKVVLSLEGVEVVLGH